MSCCSNKLSTASNSSTTDQTGLTPDQIEVCTLLSQRNRFFALIGPPPRYVPISPYPTYTKPQLDMRRKIEILQYKKNSSQTNQPTKSQKWAQIANGSKTTFICNKNPYSTTPTTACDVPGPPILLSYDPTIPLYNYSTSQDVYADFNKIDNTPWSFYSDISGGNMMLSKCECSIGTLAIQYIPEPTTIYKMAIPVGLYVSGNWVGSQPPISPYTFQYIQIKNATLNIYYAGSADPTPYLSIPLSNTYSNTNIFDISMAFVPTGLNYTFEGSQYLGDFIIPNISLQTNYGFLYDIKFYTELTLTTTGIATMDQNITNLTYKLYVNFPAYDISTNGCVIPPQIPPRYPTYYTPFFFST